MANFVISILAGVTIAAFAANAASANNLATNGSFEILTNGPGQIGHNTNATGWTIGNYPYTFVFAAGLADISGATGINGPTLPVKLWGPNNGSANDLPASSPDGGNFIAMNGNFPSQPTGPLSQVITGLTAGEAYTVGFDYGFAQQEGAYGSTIQNWTVMFGGQTATTENVNLPSRGFSGWQRASFAFIATSAAETLSFVAFGNNTAQPFALLDGVTVSQPLPPGGVPEPSSWAMLITGFGGIGTMLRRRRRSATGAA